MSEEQTERLNFYSKYNIARQKIQIATLYDLIDNSNQQLLYLQSKTITLNTSRIDEQKFVNSNQYQKKNNQFIISRDAQEANKALRQNIERLKIKQMQQKIKRLQTLEKNLQEQLEKNQKEHVSRQQRKQQKRLKKEFYKQQLINIMDKAQNLSEQSKDNFASCIEFNQSSQKIDDLFQDELDDYYCCTSQIPFIDSEDTNQIRESKKQIKRILQIQKLRQLEQQQIQQIAKRDNLKFKLTKSLVVQRESMVQKVPSKRDIQNNQKDNLDLSNHQKQEKILIKINPQVMKELKQSQSIHAIIIQTNPDQSKPLSQKIDQKNIQTQQYQTQTDQFHVEKASYAVQLNERQWEQKFNSRERQVFEQISIDPPLSIIMSESNENIDYLDKGNKQILEQFANQQQNPFQQKISEQKQNHQQVNILNENYAQLNEQTSKQKLQIIQGLTNNYPLIDIRNDKNCKDQKIFQSQIQEIQLQQSPLEMKTSFKKFISEKRANLIPRLTISTIINQQINEVKINNQFNNGQYLPPLVMMNESKIESNQNSMIKPNKINFKNALKNQKTRRNEQKINFNKIQPKNQQSRKLIFSFFEEN